MKLQIPYAFIRDRLRMSWQVVLFGLDHQLLDPGAPVDLASEQLPKEASPPPALAELAGKSRDAATRPQVESLAATEKPESDYEVRRKWVYLVLAWLFEHKDQYPDPLGAVEEVYTQLGHPQHIVRLVRYLPTGGRDFRDWETFEARFFDRWKAYLETSQKKYAPT